ncbi:mechanosensitive ion channel domain-containing protein [Thalassoglobus sp. JC818]|uniref:mechanosensitive ion channel family protein n=1 Tax=Thalassoglobus sp. JC818 TaxID=3232136 RepID=UPI00345A88E1
MLSKIVHGRFDSQELSRFGFATFLLLGMLFLPPASIHAQEADSDPPATATSSDEESPKPTTTADPDISIESLELLVKPLTQDELVVEAEGWRDFLKDQVSEIAKLRINIINKKEEEAAQAEAGTAEPTAEADANADNAPEADEDGAAPQTGESLAKLQDEKTHLVDRLNVVLDELELKGGDVETFRQYVAAQSGVAVDVTDTATTMAMIRSWLVSDQGGKRWMWNIIKFLAILICFYFGATIISNLVRSAVSRVKGTSQLLVNFIGKFVKQLLMIVGLMISLAALEVNIAPLLAAVGAAGFVVGLALQGTLSNFASGLLILGYRPFDTGDVIEAAGISGIVDSVSLFSTHIRTFDNKLMIVPNNEIWGGTITNATASQTRRVDMVFGIGYDDDIHQAKTILEELVNEHELVLKDPAPVVKLNELADSSLNFIVRPWTKTGDYWTVYWDLTTAVKERFDQAGISIPYPQRDVHVYQENGKSENA